MHPDFSLSDSLFTKACLMTHSKFSAFGFRLIAVMMVLVVASSTPLVADAPSDIDPHGRPKRFVPGKHRMYGIWYEDGIWKLRTTSAKDVRIEFLGSVELDSDKITADYTALDRARKPKDSDFVRMKKSRRRMEFRFVTIGKVDGIDFKVGKRAKTITFNLRAADDDDPRIFFIGEKSVNPEKGIFVLPAHPDLEKEK